MAIAVALLAVKALASCAGLPRDLIVHGAAFFASFAARVALAFAFLMLKDNAKCAYQMPRNIRVLKLCLSIKSYNEYAPSIADMLQICYRRRLPVTLKYLCVILLILEEMFVKACLLQSCLRFTLSF